MKQTRKKLNQTSYQELPKEAHFVMATTPRGVLRSTFYTTKGFSVDGIARLPRDARARVVDLRFGASRRFRTVSEKNKPNPARVDRQGVKFSFGKIFSRVSQLTALSLIIMLAGLPAVSAFEAHIVNVTATFVQIDPPVLTPPGTSVAWNNTGGGTNLTGTVIVTATSTDPDAHYIFFTSGAGTTTASVANPICGQPVVPGISGGGQIPIQIVQLSLTSDRVIKAIACDGNTGAAHKSVTNVKIYDFADLDAPVADQYSPIADSFVEEDNPTTNKGTDDKLKIKSRDSGRDNRAFIRFDFRFPGGTTINSSSLNLFMKKAPDSSRTYEARKVTGAWTETGITWANQPATSTTVTATTTTGTTDDVTLSWNVKTDVAAFVSGASANNGWALSDSSENSATERKSEFISRDKDGADEPKRPYLQVNFTAPSASTTHLVINEVYPFVGDGKGTEASNEWVEIYNPTGASVAIAGWQLCDSTACDTIATGTPAIPSHGFALIANATTTWSSFWAGTPAAAIKIGLGSTIGGNGLGDAGDRVILKDGPAGHAIVDTMSYGSDTTYMTLPAPKIGISLARIVKGYDTNTATDWILNATANPGTNPSVNGTEVMRFTDDGVEVAATEADLPPLPDSAPDPTAGELAAEDIPPQNQAITEDAPDASADTPAAEPSSGDEILADTQTGSGDGTTSAGSSGVASADVANTPAAEADSPANDSPAIDEVSSNDPSVTNDSNTDPDDSASSDNLDNAGDSTSSTDSSEAAPQESDSSTPSESNQVEAVLPEPDDSSQITQPSDVAPAGDVPPPPPDSGSATPAPEPTTGDALASE